MWLTPPISLTTQMDFYKQTKKELMKNNELLQFLYTWVTDLGVPETQANSTNIIRKLSKVRQQILTIEAKSAALGYTSVEVALKALGQMKSDKYVDASHLPEVLQNLPYIWVN